MTKSLFHGHFVGAQPSPPLQLFYGNVGFLNWSPLAEIEFDAV